IRVGLLIWKKKEIGRNPIYLIGSLAAVILVGYTGHLGGQMVHKPVPAAPAKAPAASPGASPAASPAPAATAAPAK
ncbi:hypothetical protein AB4Z22_10385, partial [Paenibacillus sp. TAF58]